MEKVADGRNALRNSQENKDQNGSDTYMQRLRGPEDDGQKHDGNHPLPLGRQGRKRRQKNKKKEKEKSRRDFENLVHRFVPIIERYYMGGSLTPLGTLLH